MATTQHYLWAGGHFLLLFSSIRYFLAAVTFRSASETWYKASLLGALISYAIVCHKSLGNPQLNATWFKRAALDENMQYFILALFWYSSKPVTIALVPYAIFSLFHWLTFTRTTLLPQLFPPTIPAGGGTPQLHPVAKKVQVWVKDNYDRAMRFVAYAELVILLRVTLGLIFLQNSFVAPIIYAHFLRQRYYHSLFSREAIAYTAHQIDAYTRKPGIPPVVGRLWEDGKYVISRWAGGAIVPNQAGPQAGAQAGAQAGGRAGGRR